MSGADLREIVRRDGSRCVYCGRVLDFEAGESGKGDATFDHIIRLVDGGSNTPDNICCACRTCNQRNNLAHDTETALARLRLFLARKPGRRMAA
jgi:5-methylcytosine-specific restriction endonuclease McrA